MRQMQGAQRWASRKLKNLRQREARFKKYRHEKKSHKVVKTISRDFRMVDGDFDFYWRRAWLCLNCDVDWPTWT
jgi:hypothetical protein